MAYLEMQMDLAEDFRKARKNVIKIHFQNMNSLQKHIKTPGQIVWKLKCCASLKVFFHKIFCSLSGF